MFNYTTPKVNNTVVGSNQTATTTTKPTTTTTTTTPSTTTKPTTTQPSYIVEWQPKPKNESTLTTITTNNQQ